MHVSQLSRTELVAMAGGALLAVCLFVHWYGTNPSNPNAKINGARGDFSAWQVHPIMRWLLLAAALSPFILTYIIVRGHQLSWARGEMTAVVAIIAFGLIAYNGLISKPGTPTGQISLDVGFWGALLGSILMIGGAALRASETERGRKPPGVL